MTPAIAVFTKENPCTKIEIHNCFSRGGVYANQPLVQAQTIIGENCPKYLIKSGYVVVRTIAQVDHYCLTPEGDNWLRLGIRRYLTIHPERLGECIELPPGFTRQVIRRGAQTPVKSVQTPPPVRRFIGRTKP